MKKVGIMLDEIKNQMFGYEIIDIKKENFISIFEVYDTNKDFFLITQGGAATVEVSIKDIDALPPNCEIEQKTFISIWKEGKVVGILDLIEKYPTQTSFWIGLLLVHGSLHDKRIGSMILNAVLNAGKKEGYKTVQLGVLNGNNRGMKFWEKHGFSILRYSENIVIMGKHV